MEVYNRRVPALLLPRSDPGSDAGVIPARPARPATSAQPAQPAQPGRLLLADCCAPGSAFAGLVAAIAERQSLDHRALGVRTLLHLPRVATGRGYLTRNQVDRELYFAARQLRQDSSAARHLISAGKAELKDLIFGPVPPAQAEAIFSSLHYLRSGRPGSLNFALIDPDDGLPVTVCSVSPLEWRRIGAQIHARFDVPIGRIWDVSRVYSRNEAPPNAISFLLSRVRSAVRRGEHDVQLLITAVDPNLGFSGSSYRAASWRRWFTIQARPYLYHDRRYVSPRQLKHEFGTSNLAELQVRYPGHRFEQSRVRLLDSMIFCCRLNGETEAVPSQRLHR
jgi:hypothetical protein